MLCVQPMPGSSLHRVSVYTGFVVLALHASGIFLLRKLLSNRTPVKKKLTLGVLGVTHKRGSKAKQQDDRKQRQPASQD